MSAWGNPTMVSTAATSLAVPIAVLPIHWVPLAARWSPVRLRGRIGDTAARAGMITEGNLPLPRARPPLPDRRSVSVRPPGTGGPPPLPLLDHHVDAERFRHRLGGEDVLDRARAHHPPSPHQRGMGDAARD